MRATLTSKVRALFLTSVCVLLLACSLSGAKPDIQKPPLDEPPAGLKPTKTPLPLTSSNSPQPPEGKSSSTFHINFQLDEKVGCTSTGCDSFYFPKMVLYFLGSFNSLGSGEGIMRFVSVDPCQTLKPDLSSCAINGVSDGSFSVDAEVLEKDASGNPARVRMTLHLKELPRLDATMTTQHPVQGAIEIPFGNTISEELSGLLRECKVFETAIEGSTRTNPGPPVVNYNASYNFDTYDGKMTRTLHGNGGLYFVDASTTLPPPATP